MNYILTLGFLALGPLLLTALSIPYIKRLAWSFGLVDHPAQGGHKSHQRPTPYGGGMAIFLGTLFPVVIFLLYTFHLILSSADPTFLWAPVSAFFLKGIKQVSILVGCASILFLVGLIDDWRGLPPLPRFLIETATACILVFEAPAFRLTLFTDHALVAVPLTVLWIVSLTNAFNFLDNMDGLIAGIAAIALVFLALIALHGGHIPCAILALVLVGAIGGFLLYNFPPASVFMGDAGGLFLGFLISGISVLLSHHFSQASPHPVANFPRLLAPLLVLIVPVYDLMSVVLIRLGNGRPPWIGDNNHISHRLVHLGLSRRRAVLAIYLLTLLTGLPAFFVLRTGSWTAWLLVFLVVAFSGLMAAIDFQARRLHRPA